VFCCKLNEANTLYIHYTINIYQSRFVSLQTGWSERSIINGRRDLSHQWNRATDLACQVTSLPCFFCGQCFSLSSQVFQNCKQLRFAAECKKRWNMNKAEIEDFWLECLNDTTVPKSSWPALGNCSHLPFTTQNKMCFYVSFSQLNWFVFFLEINHPELRFWWTWFQDFGKAQEIEYQRWSRIVSQSEHDSERSAEMWWIWSSQGEKTILAIALDVLYVDVCCFIIAFNG
jgi:hypothetical protein